MIAVALRGFTLAMSRKASLHFIDSSSRHRAELARVGFSLGHHSEVYGDLSELSSHPPREGIIIARDSAEEGGVAVILDRLGKLGIWLPLIAVEAQPRPGRIVEAIKAGALDICLCHWMPTGLRDASPGLRKKPKSSERRAAE
ncbi:hypothetical protein [Erythrobacter ani]|uniref:hypothetical protein n=1 Tax=Erythrobacter ani TaxID=2827235 RepID=UPI002104E7CB|nr:hypothetical protein [Erythrobacter ani]